MTARPRVALTDAGPLGAAIAEALVGRGYGVALYHDALARARAIALRDAHGVEAIELGAWHELDAAVDAAPPAHAVIAFDRWEGGGGGPLGAGGRGDGGVYDRTVAGNLEPVYGALRAFLRPLVAARAGSVVVLGSRLAERPWEGGGAAIYTAAKAAALALARTAAEEVRPYGVRVNAILTGALDEPAYDPAVAPAAVARAVAFLLSDDAAEVTGAVIPMHGAG